jgi:hypothetical protein
MTWASPCTVHRNGLALRPVRWLDSSQTYGERGNRPEASECFGHSYVSPLPGHFHGAKNQKTWSV